MSNNDQWERYANKSDDYVELARKSLEVPMIDVARHILEMHRDYKKCFKTFKRKG